MMREIVSHDLSHRLVCHIPDMPLKESKVGPSHRTGNALQSGDIKAPVMFLPQFRLKFARNY